MEPKSLSRDLISPSRHSFLLTQITGEEKPAGESADTSGSGHDLQDGRSPPSHGDRVDLAVQEPMHILILGFFNTTCPERSEGISASTLPGLGLYSEET